MHFRPHFLLTEQGSEGNGSTAHDEKGGKAPDLNAIAASLIAKHGSEPEALRVVLNENYRYRDQLRDMKSKLPADGSVVLAGDDARAYDAYRTLGKPDELRKVVREHGEASQRLARFEREKDVAAFGKKAGVPADKFPLLVKLSEGVTFGTETRKGKAKSDEEAEVVTVKDGDAEPVDFDVYFADALDSLRPGRKPEPEAAARTSGMPRKWNGGRPSRPQSQSQEGPRKLDPENPDDIKESLRAAGLGAF